jgi:hypothetical protein
MDIFIYFPQLSTFLHLRYVWLIDIERKNRLLKVCYVPAASASFLAFFLFFLLWPLTALMKKQGRRYMPLSSL